MVCLSKFFKSCLPQNLLGPLLNTLSQTIKYQGKQKNKGSVFSSINILSNPEK